MPSSKLRKGDVLDGEESAAFITRIKSCLPGCVKKALLRADGECFSWESVLAATKAGLHFIIANKRGKPPFDPRGGYQPKRRNPIQYNSCVYQPIRRVVDPFAMLRFLRFLDAARAKVRPWIDNPLWRCRFSVNPSWAKNFCTEIGKPYETIT